MISRLLNLVMLAGLVVGGYYFFSHFQVQGIEKLSVKPRAAQPAPSQPNVVQTAAMPAEPKPEQPAPVRQFETSIRIATANLGPLDQKKLDNRAVSGRLVQLIKSFAIVAIQDVRDRNQNVLAELVEKVNGRDGKYDYLVPTYVGREQAERYPAFVFDGNRVEIDRSKAYSVEDPHSRLSQRPLVATFRARGPDASQAFTFSLINVHVEPTRAVTEVDVLADVFRVVRDNGYGEDDVILLGDLESNPENLGRLATIPYLTWAISGVSTTTRGTRLVDNLLFDARATSEFTGRSSVMDLMAEFEISMREAIEISDHLPVWAEFDVYEGGRAGQMAGRGSVEAAR